MAVCRVKRRAVCPTIMRISDDPLRAASEAIGNQIAAAMSADFDNKVIRLGKSSSK